MWPFNADWWVMGKPLAFVLGVPTGIVVGVLVGAILDLVGYSHGAAAGALSGLGSGAVVGGVMGRKLAETDYKWQSKKLGVTDSQWDAVVLALKVTAAKEHYLLVQEMEDYLVFAPSLVVPVAAGPLTRTGEYLSVVVTRSSDSEAMLIGPNYIVTAFENAVAAAKASRSS
jgi:hypothetical protein